MCHTDNIDDGPKGHHIVYRNSMYEEYGEPYIDLSDFKCFRDMDKSVTGAFTHGTPSDFKSHIGDDDTPLKEEHQNCTMIVESLSVSNTQAVHSSTSSCSVNVKESFQTKNDFSHLDDPLKKNSSS